MAGEYNFDFKPLDMKTGYATDETSSPSDVLSVMHQALQGITSKKLDVLDQKSAAIAEQSDLALKIGTKELKDEFAANAKLQDFAGKIGNNDILAKLGEAANADMQKLAEYNASPIAKIMESALLSFATGMSGVKHETYGETLSRDINAKTQAIHGINSSIAAVKSGIVDTKSTVDESTQLDKLRQLAAVVNKQTLDAREGNLSGQHAAIAALTTGPKDALDYLHQLHTEGSQQQQMELAKKSHEDMLANQRYDNAMAKEQLEFNKDNVAKDNARADAQLALGIKSGELAYNRDERATRAQNMQLDKIEAAQALDEARVARYQEAITKLGANLRLNSDPKVAVEELKTARASKDPDKRAMVDALDTYVWGNESQASNNVKQLDKFDIYGYNPYAAMKNTAVLQLPNLSVEERKVVDFQRGLFNKLNTPVTKPVVTKNAQGQTVRTTETISPAAMASVTSEQQREYLYNTEATNKALDMAADVEAQGKDNIYAPPSLQALAMIPSVANTKFFADVIKPLADSGQTVFEAKDIIDKAIAAKNMGTIPAKSLQPVLQDIVKAVIVSNNVQRNYVGHALPRQDSYFVHMEHPVTGVYMTFNLDNPTDMARYISIREYETSRNVIQKAYDASGMHGNWMKWATPADREAAGLPAKGE